MGMAMPEFLNSLGTPFQGATLLTVIGIAIVWWIRGMPDRHRAKNEGQMHDDADDEKRRRERRQEIHDIKGELAKAVAELVRCNQLATAANARNEQLMFLYELLLSEAEAHDPTSKIVQRARLSFNRISTDLKDPNKSDARNTVELAVEDAKQSLASTKDARDEVIRSEDDNAV